MRYANWPVLSEICTVKNHHKLPLRSAACSCWSVDVKFILPKMSNNENYQGMPNSPFLTVPATYGHVVKCCTHHIASALNDVILLNYRDNTELRDWQCITNEIRDHNCAIALAKPTVLWFHRHISSAVHDSTILKPESNYTGNSPYHGIQFACVQLFY